MDSKIRYSDRYSGSSGGVSTTNHKFRCDCCPWSITHLDKEFAAACMGVHFSLNHPHDYFAQFGIPWNHAFPMAVDSLERQGYFGGGDICSKCGTIPAPWVLKGATLCKNCAEREKSGQTAGT